MAVSTQTHPHDRLEIDRREMPYTLNEGLGERGRIGLIVLATDQSIEHEFRLVLERAPGVALYQSRIDNAADITPETLAAMEAGITDATRVIVPQKTLDVVAYACTSGTLVIGEQLVHDRIRAARAGVACTTPMEAARAALTALDARSLCFLPPYRDDINRSMREALLTHGFEVPVMGSWNISDDDKVARLSEDTLREAVLDLGALSDTDAVFIPCTSVRIAGIVEDVERALGKPVISSNLATIWHCLRLAGFADDIDGFGTLFRRR